MSDIYSTGEYRSMNPTWHSEDSEWKAGHIADLLDRHGMTPASIIDVGCGTGKVLRALEPHVGQARLFGYEPAPNVFEASGPSDRIDFLIRDPFLSETRYDLALALDVFEHIEDHRAFLRSMQQMSGKQIYHIPLDLSVQAVMRRRALLKSEQRLGHLHFFTKETALAELRQTGHRIIAWQFTAGAIELPAPNSLRRIAAIPRRLGALLSTELTARFLGGFSLLVLCERELPRPSPRLP